MNLAALEAELFDGRTKGMPVGSGAVRLGDIGSQGWNVLKEDLPLPLAVLKQSAVDHNSRWMQRFLEQSGAVLAPHGKTSMSPQLFQRQLDDGAWAITVATVQQLRVCREHGIQRVLLANQLVGEQATRYVLGELRADPQFDFYCLVDSVEGVRMLSDAARSDPAGRPLQLLVEGGFAGGRTGCRTTTAALEVARAVHAAAPYLALRGVEGFEGLISGDSASETDEQVAHFLDSLVGIAAACEAEGIFAPGQLILSAGGSAFYDLVTERFARAGIDREVTVVTRSGCYLTHDSQMYRDAFARLLDRSPEAGRLGSGPRPALEVWSYVQSRPEPGTAILNMGKRDCSFDAGLPVPKAWFRGCEHHAPQQLPAGCRVMDLNDQHAFLELPAAADLRPRDMVACGISHPCTTFDRWQLLMVVNDDYDVVSAVRTFF